MNTIVDNDNEIVIKFYNNMYFLANDYDGIVKRQVGSFTFVESGLTPQIGRVKIEDLVECYYIINKEITDALVPGVDTIFIEMDLLPGDYGLNYSLKGFFVFPKSYADKFVPFDHTLTFKLLSSLNGNPIKWPIPDRLYRAGALGCTKSRKLSFKDMADKDGNIRKAIIFEYAFWHSNNNSNPIVLKNFYYVPQISVLNAIEQILNYSSLEVELNGQFKNFILDGYSRRGFANKVLYEEVLI
jgi:hypothetical protein